MRQRTTKTGKIYYILEDGDELTATYEGFPVFSLDELKRITVFSESSDFFTKCWILRGQGEIDLDVILAEIRDSDKEKHIDQYRKIDDRVSPAGQIALKEIYKLLGCDKIDENKN